MWSPGKLFVFILVFLFTNSMGLSEKFPKTKFYTQIPADVKLTRTVFNINQFTGWISWYGLSGAAVNDIIEGIAYPGPGPTAIYCDGFQWGGYVRDGIQPVLRANGQTYYAGMVPGRIISTGVAQAQDDPDVRIYRIRRDWQQMSGEELLEEASFIFNGDYISFPLEQRLDSIKSQYERDWNEWPVHQGAPWYDLNHNGQFDPGIDQPGIANASQVIWFVCNDLDESQSSDLYGVPPIGIECQVTLWAYELSTDHPLGNAVFRRYRLINKSGAVVDSMYVGRWADPDIGLPTDDLVGCDSIHNYAFAYNREEVDVQYSNFGLAPSAAGYILLQGPVVPSSGDTALFDFKHKTDFKNLPMTSFVYQIPPPDWCWTGYPFTLFTYNLLRGYGPTTDVNNPTPNTHVTGPLAGRPTRFPLNGDPLTGSGDIDSRDSSYLYIDRRMMLSSGPFTMQPGDTQEVVVATVGGISDNRLASFAEMRGNMLDIESGYGKTPLIPDPSYELTQLDSSHMELQLRINFWNYYGIKNCRLRIYPEQGSDEAVSLSLFDDGQHRDGEAGDNLWGNTLIVQNRQYPHAADVTVETAEEIINVEEVFTDLSLRPEPILNNFRIIWENGRQDGQLNTYEQAMIAFDIRNPDAVHAMDELIIDARDRVQTHIRLSLPAGGIISDPSNYILQKVLSPSGNESKYIFVWVDLTYDGHHIFRSINLPEIPWQPNAIRSQKLEVTPLRGWAENMHPVIADPAKLTGHTYEIDVQSDDNRIKPLYWNLRDISTSTVKLEQMAFAENEIWPHPIVDGIEMKVYDMKDFYEFMVTANAGGILNPPEGAATQSGGYPYHRYITDRQQTSSRDYVISEGTTETNRDYSTFREAISKNDSLWEEILPWDYEIRFTPGGGLAADVHDPSVIYTVPFELWNIGSDTPDDNSDDYRMIPRLYDADGDSIFSLYHLYDSIFLERYYYSTDWINWMRPADISPGDAGYRQAESRMLAGTYQGNNEQEVMARMAILGNGRTAPEEGTVFRIITRKPPQDGDRFRFTSPQPASDIAYGYPRVFRLYPNFPNPFNNTTTIRFETPVNIKVKINIYNVLGQEIRSYTLFPQERDIQTVVWDGRNQSGQPVSSGIYIYRIQAEEFSASHKMILIR